jgi:hypothetical protein
MTNWALLGLIFFAANLPWFSSKFFYIIPLKHDGQLEVNKHLGWCLLELVALYIAVGGVAWYAERATFGQVAHQDWEFYVVTSCIFLVFAFPGFVYRVLWKKAI